MSLPESVEVLVVGAGPVGLACAISLLKHGCSDIAIVDAIPLGQNASRALAVQASALAALESVGCAEQLVAEGMKGTLTVWKGSSALLQPDFESLASRTRYPYSLILPQNVTERILSESLQSLGLHIFRSNKVVGMGPGATGYTNVTFENGSVVKTRYIVAADGAHSTIRHILGIQYKDPAQASPASQAERAKEELMTVADVTFTSTPGFSPGVHGIITQRGTLFLSHIASKSSFGSSEQLYRLAYVVDSASPPETETPEKVQKKIESLGPAFLSYGGKKVHVKDLIWISSFRLGFAIADRFFTRFGAGDGDVGSAVVLVGDAAHKHSPAGGQGMNLGICDGVALGAVIATHIAKYPKVSTDVPDDTLLVEYAAKRRARALQVIKMTRFLTNMITLKNPVLRMLRDWVICILGYSKYMRRVTAEGLSGVDEI